MPAQPARRRATTNPPVGILPAASATFKPRFDGQELRRLAGAVGSKLLERDRALRQQNGVRHRAVSRSMAMAAVVGQVGGGVGVYAFRKATHGGEAYRRERPVRR